MTATGTMATIALSRAACELVSDGTGRDVRDGRIRRTHCGLHGSPRPWHRAGGVAHGRRQAVTQSRSS
jgi:hypothetical protein